MGPDDRPTKVHALRQAIDAVIKQAQLLDREIVPIQGGREMDLTITKLQEGKMWAGKVLEQLGSELPKEYRDEAVPVSTGVSSPIQE